MHNSFRARAASLALASSLLFGGAAVTGAASARSMPYEPRSPIAAAPFSGFSGSGRGWRIDIRAHRSGESTIRMRLRDGSEWRGALRYGGPVMDMPGNFVVMSGQLRNGLAMLPVTVEIDPRQRCRTGGRRGPGSVTVHGVEQQPLRGCGAATGSVRYR